MEFYLVSAAVTLMAFWRHRSNIVRLLHGTENKIGSKKNKRQSMPPGRTSMAKIGIIGAGTWGIALSVLLHDNGHKISVWSALPQEIKDLQEKHEHKTFLA